MPARSTPKVHKHRALIIINAFAFGVRTRDAIAGERERERSRTALAVHVAPDGSRRRVLAKYTCDKQQNCVATRAGPNAGQQHTWNDGQKYAHCAGRHNAFPGEARAVRLSHGFDAVA